MLLKADELREHTNIKMPPILCTKLGKLQGKIDEASDGTEYYTFHGIPYAQPPIAELRFKAPVPALPWSGVLDATIEGDESYSKHQVHLNPVGSEDCLKLNVYTHSIEQNAKKPVMVWIHGGGFTAGSSKIEAYGPDFFMCEDIVLVTVNYRLGIFGFLSLNDKSLRVPGNAGLKDQVMALRWVQENIDCFGGDPNNVTLFGESAGGASVNYLMCSPMAAGLFHKVIIQSGSALNHWARGTILPSDLVAFFKMEGKSEAEILERLMAATKEELLVAQYACRDRNRVSDPRPFSPVIEGYNPYEPSLLLDDPLTIMKSGKFIQVPMIIGYNTHEGMLLDVIENKLKICLLITNFDHAVPFKYGLKPGTPIIKKVGDKIKTFYYGTSNPADETSRKCFRDMQTDNFFLRGIYQGLQEMVKTNAHPIYFYRFAFEGDLNIYKHLANVTDEGVCHGDDVFYMFKTMITPEIAPNSNEEKTIKRFVKFWTNFAKTSDPNPTVPNGLLDCKWPKTDGNILLHFGEDLKVIDFPEIDRMMFWDKIDVITSNKL